MSAYNYLDSPVRRDTVTTGNASDAVTFRFVTDNAGPWFLHWYVTKRGPRYLTTNHRFVATLITISNCQSCVIPQNLKATSNLSL